MNMRMAWIENGVVDNFVMIRPEQVGEFTSDSVELVDPGALDVQVGDTWDRTDFWRDEVKVTLPEEAEDGLSEDE